MRPDTLEQLVELAELEATLAMMAEDRAAGVVPAWANRPLYAHELAARTNFAAIDEAAARLTDDLATTLTHARARLLELIADHVAAAADVADAYRRVLDLRTAGIDTLAGAGDVIEATRASAENLLFEHAMAAAERARAEAIAQGVADVPDAVLGLATVDRLDEQARRLAQGPPADLLRTVQDEVTVRRPSTTTPGELAGHIRNLGGTLSPAPIREAAGTAAATVEGTARAGTADSIGVPAAVYASELLDSNTCAPCSMVDGHRYSDTTEARVDYPGGIFRNCAGGPRCRGTLVFVWDTEAVPTVDNEPPPGPATLPPEGPPPAPPGPPPAPPTAGPSPAALAPDEPTAEELDTARRDLRRIRAQYRAHAHDVQENARGFFDDSDTFRMQQPPPRTLRRRDPATGRVTLERDSAANWDWFDALHPDEQKRLRRTWMSDPSHPLSPDALVAHLRDRYGIEDEATAINTWLEQTRRYDAGGLVARGRLPIADSYGGADVNALVDSPYDLRRLFGNDLEAAAREVAVANAAEGEELAARIFPSVRPGFDPPWAMTEQAWSDEVAALEARVEAIVPLDDEWAAYSVEDQATLDRLRELVPPSLDDEDHPLPLPDLWRKIVAMARRARLIE